MEKAGAAFHLSGFWRALCSLWLAMSSVLLRPISTPQPVASTTWPPTPDQPKLGVALLSTPDDFIAIPRPLPVASTVSPAAHGPVTSLRAVTGYPGIISSQDKHA